MDWDAELTASSSLQRRRELRLGVPGNALEADMQPFGRRADGKLKCWHLLLQPATTIHCAEPKRILRPKAATAVTLSTLNSFVGPDPTCTSETSRQASSNPYRV